MTIVLVYFISGAFILITMDVTVNNNVQSIQELTNLDSLIEQLNLDAKGIAIAVNLTVVTKSEWNQTILKQNDNITIIKATQGG